MKIKEWILYELFGFPRPRLGTVRNVKFYSGGRSVRFYKRNELKGGNKNE